MMRNTFYKIIVIALITGLNYTGLSAIGNTVAVFTNTESTAGNFFISGSLDVSLNASFESDILMPGDSLEGSMTIHNEGTAQFQYAISASVDDEDSCGLLWLEVGVNGDGVYLGSITSFLTSPYLFSSNNESWQFILTLPEGAPSEVSLSECEVTFLVEAWQPSLYAGVGFHDEETQVVPIVFGEWEEAEQVLESEEVFAYSPIQDAEVKQGSPDTSYGSATSLSVTSDDTANTRFLIKFGLPLPLGTTVHSATLNLFTHDAPALSRTLSVGRAGTSWNESTATWNNQPGIAASTGDIITGNTSNVWLSLDVTSDVAGFADGTFDNNGWVVRDQAEDGAGEGISFRSREYGTSGVRPTLDLTLTLPVVATDHVVINEVYSDVAGDKGTEALNEWIELYNPTASPVDISGWDICDNTSCDTIPATTTIPAFGFAVITNDASTETYWTIPLDAVVVLIGSSIGNGLAGTGDELLLRDTTDTTVDWVSYGTNTDAFTPSVSAPLEGVSLSRVVKGFDTDTANDWVQNATPNPGTNPGSDTSEVIRITSDGWFIAPASVGVPELEVEGEPVVETPFTPVPQTVVSGGGGEPVNEESKEKTEEIISGEEIVEEEVATSTEEFIEVDTKSGTSTATTTDIVIGDTEELEETATSTTEVLEDERGDLEETEETIATATDEVVEDVVNTEEEITNTEEQREEENEELKEEEVIEEELVVVEEITTEDDIEEEVPDTVQDESEEVILDEGHE